MNTRHNSSCLPENLTRATCVLQEAILATGVTSLELCQRRVAVSTSVEFFRRVERKLGMRRGGYAHLDGDVADLLEMAESVTLLAANFIDDDEGAAMHTYLASTGRQSAEFKRRVWALAMMSNVT